MEEAEREITMMKKTASVKDKIISIDEVWKRRS